jgi:hypothetical protein
MKTLQDMKKLYEQDFVEWCEATVDQLKSKDLENLDLENLIEEVESLGRRDRRELKSRLTVLLAHLLKRTYVESPENFNGWELTIREQRRQLQDLLTDSPSLKPYLREILETVYATALSDVKLEYQNAHFPETFPFNPETEMLLSDDDWEE